MLIELEGITFSYGPDQPPVFREYSFSASRGECVALKGENGAGKTTLFRILNGLSFPQAGVYRFDGEEITRAWLKNQKRAKRFHKRIGYLFQNPDVMLFNASVRDEVAFGPRQMGLPAKEVDERVRDCLSMLEILDLSEKAPYHLSGGQKKRVALASVLSLSPEVLILDEPFAGLDEKSRALLLHLLQQLRQSGKTLLFASHEPALCDMADRIVELSSREHR